MNTPSRQILPAIAISADDHERLVQLAEISVDKFPAAEFLGREVERAKIVAGNGGLAGVVRMGSEVEFRDEVTGQVRTMTLVYPEDADVSVGRISVLTPIGAALIGLSVGQSIEWQMPAGGWRSLTVLKSRDPI